MLAAVGRTARWIYLFLALSVVLWYWPLALLVYGSSAWYDFNCQFHERCQRFGLEKTQSHAKALVRYFRHQDGELQGEWTARERAHLAEVRGIYDALLLIFLLAALSLLLAWALRAQVAWRWLILGQWLWPLGALALLPVFQSFWHGPFHDLLFNNDLWKYTRAEVSYYLMPNVFFRNSLIFMMTLVVFQLLLLTAAVFLWRRARPNPATA
jgi:uncharacterized membrane protein